MKLIIKTLLSVLCVQILAFSYIKFFHNKTKDTLPKHKIITLAQINMPKEATKNSSMPNVSPIAIKEKSTMEKRSVPKNQCYIVKYSTLHYSPKEKSLKRTINTNTKVEKYAKRFLGHKYVWGATGPKTFDCSGFTQKVYKQTIGVVIPRVSREQAKVGKYVKYSELKKGDMVFFDTTKKRLGKVNHVGIYLSDGNFIHASSGGKKVMITNFNKKRFYKNRFLWGRRIIQEHTTVASLAKNKHKNKEES